MSKETVQWLNENTMLGFTNNREMYAKNGYTFEDEDGKVKAWWQQEDYRWAYDGAVPVDDVMKVLFNWQPMETEVWNRKYLVDSDGLEADGMTGDGRGFIWVRDPDRKGIMHPTNETIYGYFGKDSYTVHGYGEWLIEKVADIVDGEIGVASAGLLRRGGVAYVTLQLPEDVVCESGLEIRPTIVASTSLDGTKATQYKVVTMIPVCDNSLDAALNGAGSSFKVKHSMNSVGKLNDARMALGLVYKQGEEMAKFLDSLTEVSVSDDQMHKIIEGTVSVPEVKSKDGKVTNQRTITISEKKQAEMWSLWSKDERASRFNGTLLGAYQTINTWNEQYRPNNDNGVERVMTGVLSGEFAKADEKFWEVVGGMDLNLDPMLDALAEVRGA